MHLCGIMITGVKVKDRQIEADARWNAAFLSDFLSEKNLLLSID